MAMVKGVKPWLWRFGRIQMPLVCLELSLSEAFGGSCSVRCVSVLAGPVLRIGQLRGLFLLC